MSFDELDLTILKSILTNKKHGLDFANEVDLTKQQFFTPELWNFANLTVSYIKTHKDLPTLRVISEKLSKNEKLLNNVKIIWGELDKITVNDNEYKHDLDKLKKRFAEKQIVTMQENLSKLNMANLDVTKVMADVQKTVQNIRSLNQAKAFTSKDIKEYLPTFVEKFNAKKENPNVEKGLMTGYSYLDFATNRY